MNINVEREAPDRLSKRVWKFWVHCDIGRQYITAELDSYEESSRPSRRHVYRKTEQVYYRTDRRNSWLLAVEVPQPADVYNEAFMAVADSIQVAVRSDSADSIHGERVVPFGNDRT